MALITVCQYETRSGRSQATYEEGLRAMAELMTDVELTQDCKKNSDATMTDNNSTNEKSWAVSPTETIAVVLVFGVYIVCVLIGVLDWWWNKRAHDKRHRAIALAKMFPNSFENVDPSLLKIKYVDDVSL
ncbi:hypothetical protein Ciccas_006175 [Cichlidogyrus casuarinus]|uniref:Uncharacterized protein n=1 Tax=Cichlidogyrus casuarinus TaxID=1844966 RepID=A0ABD2Q708_9PLAT